MSVITESFTGLKIKPDLDDGSTDDQDFEGWWCIKTDPWPCPICSIVVHFCTVDHRIIVFPEKDDENILKLAAWAKGDNPANVDRNPRIIEYEADYGPCISYYNFHFIEHS
jgi:hypothetical protein